VTFPSAVTRMTICSQFAWFSHESKSRTTSFPHFLVAWLITSRSSSSSVTIWSVIIASDTYYAALSQTVHCQENRYLYRVHARSLRNHTDISYWFTYIQIQSTILMKLHALSLIKPINTRWWRKFIYLFYGRCVCTYSLLKIHAILFIKHSKNSLAIAIF